MIRAKPNVPRSRQLRIVSVSFDGTKMGDAVGPIKFDWDNMGPGLLAVLSDRNFRGKSTIINVIHAALRGDFPGKLKPDIGLWLTQVAVKISIDHVIYLLQLSKNPGEVDAANAQAKLCRLDGDHCIPIYEGPGGANFQSHVEMLFMDELGFSNFYAFNQKHGDSHSHGWKAISSALFIRGPSSAIIGTVFEDAMPLRLLQLFMGLPWVTTYTAALTAAKKSHFRARGL